MGQWLCYRDCQGLIDYAFETKGLNRVTALIKPDNVSSEKVAIKCGMHLEKQVIRDKDKKMHLYVIENS